MKELILNQWKGRKLLLAFLFSFLLPAVSLAQAGAFQPQGFVSDFAGLLAPSEIEELNVKLSDFEKSTGVEIAVVTIPSLEGDTIENFAVELFEEWGIGKKGQDNGALLLVARDDRAVRIEVGYGLEGVLTDIQSYWIIQNVIVPAFQTGNFFEGINGAVDEIIGAAGGEEIPAYQSSPQGGSNSFIFQWFWLIFFLPIWLASILGRSKSWWAGGVLGGIAGVILGIIYGFVFTGIISIAVLVPSGLLFDFLVSRAYARGKVSGHIPWWIGGGRGGGFGGGGFGGFGGGHSGGGGASGRW